MQEYEICNNFVFLLWTGFKNVKHGEIEILVDKNVSVLNSKQDLFRWFWSLIKNGDSFLHLKTQLNLFYFIPFQQLILPAFKKCNHWLCLFMTNLIIFFTYQTRYGLLFWLQHRLPSDHSRYWGNIPNPIRFVTFFIAI